jgi:hypothetical protein
MTKLVHPNAMVAHLWANQSQREARSSNGNLWFDGQTINSYRTAIAKLYSTADDCGLVALVSENSYSMSTGKQLGYVRRALSYRYFTVPFVTEYPGGHGRSVPHGASLHGANLLALESAYRVHVSKATKARAGSYLLAGTYEDSSVSRALQNMRDSANQVSRYAAAFGLSAPAIDVAADWQSVLTAHAEREAKHNTPAAIRKREKAVEARQAREAEQAAIAERQRLAALAEAQPGFAAWLAGDSHYCPSPFRSAPDGTAYLRVSGDTLETSQGAKVPLAHAIRIFRLVAECRKAGRAILMEGKSEARVGQFTVDRIDSDGSFTAGCHRIGWSEIERVARIVGLVPPEVPQGAAIEQAA